MAEMNIFQRGDKAKFIITSQNVNLNMETCDFYVELIYGMRADKLTIQKADMLYGTDGEYVLIFDTSKMIGKIKARFVWYCIDTDVDPDNRRQEVDEQYIGFVVDTPCPQLFTCPKCSSVGHDVRYELMQPSICACASPRRSFRSMANHIRFIVRSSPATTNISTCFVRVPTHWPRL